MSVLRDDYSAAFHKPKPFTCSNQPFMQGLVSPHRTLPISAQTLREGALCPVKPARKVAPWGCGMSVMFTVSVSYCNKNLMNKITVINPSRKYGQNWNVIFFSINIMELPPIF